MFLHFDLISVRIALGRIRGASHGQMSQENLLDLSARGACPAPLAHNLQMFTVSSPVLLKLFIPVNYRPALKEGSLILY